MYKPTIPSLRHKKKILSFLSSLKTHLSVDKSIFRKKIFYNHKFLNNTNSVLKLNLKKNVLIGNYFLFNWVKVNYSNIFYGFFFSITNLYLLNRAHMVFLLKKYTTIIFPPRSLIETKGCLVRNIKIQWVTIL